MEKTGTGVRCCHNSATHRTSGGRDNSNTVRKAGGHANLNGEKENTLTEWQRTLEENNTKGQWIKRLIPDLIPWIKSAFRKLNYFLTQFLTGHESDIYLQNRQGHRRGLHILWHTRHDIRY
ncbi:hypothetical protein JTB14_028252 [Gonioctena quinquepunctata]|nr:hypothetical protein JTB14_028252 [Gonioctena quinquepunctata]